MPISQSWKAWLLRPAVWSKHLIEAMQRLQRLVQHVQHVGGEETRLWERLLVEVDK